MEYFVTVSINQGNGWFDCGGSFILPDVVVTAAHCLYSDSGMLTTTGIRISDKNAVGIGVAKPSAYNPFKNGDFTGDIALVLLDKEVGSEVVHVAPRGTILENTDVLVAGKGQTEEEDVSEDLRYIVVPTMSTAEVLVLFDSDGESDGDYSFLDDGDAYVEIYESQEAYYDDSDHRMPEKIVRGKNKNKKDSIYKNRAYEKDHFGAGDRKADSCRGDSGGPAIWPSKSSWGKLGMKKVEEDVLVGIVSYGPAVYQCGDRGSFGLYTDVGYWQEWIDKTIAKKKFQKLK